MWVAVQQLLEKQKPISHFSHHLKIQPRTTNKNTRAITLLINNMGGEKKWAGREEQCNH